MELHGSLPVNGIGWRLMEPQKEQYGAESSRITSINETVWIILGIWGRIEPHKLVELYATA